LVETPDSPGLAIRRAAWWGTALFAFTAIAAVVAPDPPAEVPAFVVAVGLFLTGCVLFAVAYARAVSRSRYDLIGIADLFFLAGETAPPEVRRSLLGALATEVAVALATAIARPYSSLAAGVLAPVYGLALCGVWASRHGTFQPRAQPPPARGGRGAGSGKTGGTKPKPSGRVSGRPGQRSKGRGASGRGRGRRRK
jgi:hypothetical protein